MISWLRTACRRQLDWGLAALGYSAPANVSAEQTTQWEALRQEDRNKRAKPDTTALEQSILAAKKRKGLGSLVSEYNSAAALAINGVLGGWQIKQGRFLVEFPKIPIVGLPDEKNFEVIGEGNKAILVLPCVWLDGKIVQRGLISYE